MNKGERTRPEVDEGKRQKEWRVKEDEKENLLKSYEQTVFTT
jgi:hypothetical protein